MLTTLKIIPMKTKHKKLSENWVEAKPVVMEGMKFTSKYIGMTLVDSSKGEEMVAAAIKRIHSANKASMKEPPLVMLTVSPKGILIKDASTDEIIDDVGISRISFCTADKSLGKVFGFVARNPNTETFECHAYMCGNRKEAQRLTLTVAHAFSIAYEFSNKEEGSDKNVELPAGSSGFTLDNKKIANIYRYMADSKYKRLADSFGSSLEEGVGDADNSNVDDDDETVENLSFDFLKDIPSSGSSSQTTKIGTASQTKPKTLDVVVSIMPPPSVKGKNSSRARVSTLTGSLVNIPVEKDIYMQKPNEAESIDLDFAQLALSRTRGPSNSS